MTLKKGFLRKRFTYKDLNLTKYEAILYATIWFSGALVIFLLIISVKEAFRFFTYNSVVDDVFLLSNYGANFFNFFYACLACFFSFSLVASHILQRPSALRDIKTYTKRTILNDLSGFQNFFIFWYFKMAIFFAVLSVSIPFFLYVNFSEEYKYLFPSILVVLYLHCWLKLRVVFKNSIFKLMGLCTVLIIIMSLFLSQLPIANGKHINSSLKKFVVSTYINQDLPIATFPQVADRKHYVREFFLGMLVSDPTSIGLYVKRHRGNLERIDYSDVKRKVESEREKMPESERGQLVFTINVDKKVKFEFVKKLREELRRSYVYQILWGTHHSGQLSATGIKERLWPLCNSNMPEPCMSRDESKDFKAELMEIYIASGFVTVNGQKISLEKLIPEVKIFQAKNSEDNVIAVTVDDATTYGFYFDVKDKIRTAFQELRNEESLRQTGKKFTELDQYGKDRKIYNDVVWKWPINIIEAIDDDEKTFLNSLVSHSNQK